MSTDAVASDRAARAPWSAMEAAEAKRSRKVAGMIAWLLVLGLFFAYVGDMMACAGFFE